MGISNRKDYGVGSLLLVTAITACGTSGPAKEAAPTAADPNVPRIISHVKAEPTSITGGGMVYELFVGEQFNAEYNDKAGVLKLTDIENQTSCSYDASGMLAVPEQATQGYAAYCSNLSDNTAQHIAEE